MRASNEDFFRGTPQMEGCEICLANHRRHAAGVTKASKKLISSTFSGNKDERLGQLLCFPLDHSLCSITSSARV